MVHILVGRFDHVDEVHVGDVVQFLCAEFAHADDGEAHVLAALGFVAGDGQRAFERRVREVGQFAADGRLDGGRVVRHGILGDDGGQLVPVAGTQGRGRFGQILGGDGHGRFVRVRADRLEQTCTALRVIEQMAVAVVDCCRLHKLRLEAHELAHRVGDAEHRDQTLQGVVVGDDVFQIALA